MEPVTSEPRVLCEVKDEGGGVRGEIAVTIGEKNILKNHLHLVGLALYERLDQHDTSEKPFYFITGLKCTHPLRSTGTIDPNQKHMSADSRLLGRTMIAGTGFWVDCIHVIRVHFPDDNGGQAVEMGFEEVGGMIQASTLDGASILDEAYRAFGIEGEMQTVKIRGKHYCVFLYPAVV